MAQDLCDTPSGGTIGGVQPAGRDHGPGLAHLVPTMLDAAMPARSVTAYTAAIVRACRQI